MVELHGPERRRDRHTSKKVSSNFIKIIEYSYPRISTHIFAVKGEQIDSR